MRLGDQRERVGVPFRAFQLACARVDRDRFEPLYRAGKRIEGAGTSVSPNEVEALVKDLDLELSVANSRARTAGERNLVDLYRDARSASLDFHGAYAREMMRRASALQGITLKRERGETSHYDAWDEARKRLDVASRCWESAGDNCAIAENLTRKRAEEIVREHEASKERAQPGVKSKR